MIRDLAYSTRERAEHTLPAKQTNPAARTRRGDELAPPFCSTAGGGLGLSIRISYIAYIRFDMCQGKSVGGADRFAKKAVMGRDHPTIGQAWCGRWCKSTVGIDPIHHVYWGLSIVGRLSAAGTGAGRYSRPFGTVLTHHGRRGRRPLRTGARRYGRTRRVCSVVQKRSVMPAM